MALIHEKLYQSKDFSRINLVDYINAISQELYHTYYYDSRKIELKYDLRKVLVELERAIPCGLIINEILTNSFKYAFPNEFDKPAEISIFLHQKKDKIILKIADNGIGIPQNINIDNNKTLGLQLISILTDQIIGKYELNRTGGTEWIIEF